MPDITTEDVERLAERLGLELSPERREAVRTEVAGGLDGYATLSPEGTDYAPTVDRDPPDVTVDPGDDSDPHNAFISRFEVDGGDGPLADLDVAVKDNTAVAGAPMTCGSAVFADAVPESDAAVVTRLLEAGSTVVGKANMDELAYGPTGETSAFGAPENPAAPGRVTGGSSAGSAAAVAGSAADAALGTDTGGSVRIPAAFCGLVGVKPTWGRVPTAGVVELAYTLDHVGPLAPDLETAARVLDVIADGDTGFVDALATPPEPASLTLGLPEQFYGDHVSSTVAEAVRSCVDALADAGATVEEVSLPLVEEAVPVWNALVNVEFATFLAAGATPLFRPEGIDAAWHHGAAAGIADPDRRFGEVVQQKTVEGAYLLDCEGGDHYVAARNRRRALAEEFAAALTDCDALVTPTMPTQPIETDTWSPTSYSSGAPDATPPLAVNTRPVNLARCPALTLPVEGGTHPIGLQVIGPADGDERMLGIGATVEAVGD